MKLYGQVYGGKAIVEDERSPHQNQLKLFGLVKVENSVLVGSQRNLSPGF